MFLLKMTMTLAHKSRNRNLLRQVCKLSYFCQTRMRTSRCSNGCSCLMVMECKNVAPLRKVRSWKLLIGKQQQKKKEKRVSLTWLSIWQTVTNFTQLKSKKKQKAWLLLLLTPPIRHQKRAETPRESQTLLWIILQLVLQQRSISNNQKWTLTPLRSLRSRSNSFRLHWLSKTLQSSR